jgi:hypothetical protein
VAGAEGTAGFAGDSSDMAGVLLDTLAVVAHSDGETLAAAYEALRTAREGLVVAFLGDLDEEQATSVARIRQRAGGAVAFVLDSDDWVARDAAGRLVPVGDASAVAEEQDGTRQAVRMLREAGWTVVEVRAGDSLPELWQQADRYRSREGSEGSPGAQHEAGAAK